MSESQEILTTTVSAESFLAAVIVLVVVPSLFVLVRVANSYRHTKGLYADDWFSIVAIVFLGIICALYYIMRTTLNDPAVGFPYMGRLITAVGFMAVFTVYFAKVPILLLYLRIFGVHRGVRIVSWTLLTVPLIMLVGAAIYGAAVCSPENKTLDLVWLQGCIQPSLRIGVWNGSVSVVVDIIIFVLPLPVIAGLNLDRKKKVALAMVFLAAFLGIAASGVTLYFRGVALAGRGSSGAEVGQMLGQIIECSIAIIVGCAPALRSFWTGHITQLAIYSRLQSAFSTTRSKRSQASMDSKPPSAGASSEHIVKAHDFVALNEIRVTRDTQVVVTNEEFQRRW